MPFGALVTSIIGGTHTLTSDKLWPTVVDVADEFEHGVVGSYTNHRCRCEACRRANSEYQAQRKAGRQAQLMADPSLAQHGVATTYSNWGCRCDTCTQAWRVACADRTARRKRT
jgi:hypothetical protein